ncbi:MAG: metallophosphoesterase [Anaerovoracaceae bacterium]
MKNKEILKGCAADWLRRGAAAVLAVCLGVVLVCGQSNANAAEAEASAAKNSTAAAVQSAAAANGQAPALRAASTEGSLKIATLSDTHYLSPTMIKDTKDFTRALNSDRKTFVQSDAFLRKLLDTVKKDDPDVLLISGDLTKDGELEGHRALAGILGEFEKKTGTKVYLCPGNHDLQNKDALNFNTADGKAVPAERTTQEKYLKTYADLVYNDETVIARYKPPTGKPAGGLSYAARPQAGYTIISIDSARYSADNTESGTDEHETGGQISADQENWVLGQIKAAKKRGDTVIGMEHHGLVPHFSMEQDILPMYLVNDYERLSREYADAGMSYIFTGHMHANDIARVTTDRGNTLYDIETGSVLTFPSPARLVTLRRRADDGKIRESMSYKTYLKTGPVTYVNALNGKTETIDNMYDFEKGHGITAKMLPTAAGNLLADYSSQIEQQGGAEAMVLNAVNEVRENRNAKPYEDFDDMLEGELPLLLTPAPEDEDEIEKPKNGEKARVYYVKYRRENRKKVRAEGILVVYNACPELPNMNLDVKLFIPMKRVRTIAKTLLRTVDEKLADPAELEDTVNKLVSDVAAIRAADDPSTAGEETIVDYANYVYMRHLGGEDHGEMADWAQDTAAMLENGQLVDELINTALADLAGPLEDVLKTMDFQELTGIKYWNNKTNLFVSGDSSDPIQNWDNRDNTSNQAISYVVGGSAAGSVYKGHVGWTVRGRCRYVPDGYSFYDFISRYNGYGSDELTVKSILLSLVNGSEADHSDGLVTDEARQKLGDFGLAVVDSMGNDSSIPADNNGSIDPTSVWEPEKTVNRFTTPLTMQSWTAGEAASEPSAAAAYGEVQYRYYSDRECTCEIEKPSTPGTYYVKAFVEAGSNYDAIESAPVAFSIYRTAGETSEARIAAASAALEKTRGDRNPEGSVFAVLRARTGAVTKNNIEVKWSRVKGAETYVVFGGRCGGSKYPYRRIASASGTSLKISRVAGEKIKKGTYCKFFVAAFDDSGRQLSVSKTVHAASAGGRVGNYRAVRVKNVLFGSRKLKSGATFKLRTKLVKPLGRAVVKHRARAFESSDSSIAAVSSAGKIHAKKKGTCTIYVYAQNGVYARVKVTVK